MTDLPPLPPRKRISRRHTRPVSRSFRIPADVDRALEAEARRKRWTKSTLIREILTSWLVFRDADALHRQVPKVDDSAPTQENT